MLDQPQRMDGTIYPHMLSPLRVGQHTLRNRVIMGSMHTRLEHADNPILRQAAFYGARAKGGAALIITGGFSPNEEGRLEDGGPIFNARESIGEHKPVVDEIHKHGAKILLQILHAGRYAKHDRIVGPTEIRSPINSRAPHRLSPEEVERTIEEYVACAELAREAGYDGVELMGSEGYLINQFTALRTNKRDDAWGGTFEKRIRFAIEIVRRSRERLGPHFIIMYRISALDLVDEGLTAPEIDQLAQAVEQAGADILNTGVGWHEAPVPTIAYVVPRGAWTFAVRRLKKVVSIPIVASNRINVPEIAEKIIADGEADLVSMARPMLADPDFVNKAATGRASEINTCIACNQACLDLIFTDRIATCLVNPQACREIEFESHKANPSQRLAVVGAGPAGLAFATTAASRGHNVVLFDAASDIGGQLHLARSIPGKDEFNELLRHFRRRIDLDGVEVRLNTRVTTEMLAKEGFNRVIVASGIKPREPSIEGIDHPSVLTYIDVITGRAKVGQRVAIIGMGGIGYDVAELIGHASDGEACPMQAFYDEWGVDTSISTPGGIRPASPPPPARQITMFQRSAGKPGARLGVSTGWILRLRLKRWGVKMVTDVVYRHIDDDGLHYSVNGVDHVLEVDNVIICAGQESNAEIVPSLRKENIPFDVIGGADVAAELDAMRAIDQATRLATAI